jgi:hypothetical protein
MDLGTNRSVPAEVDERVVDPEGCCGWPPEDVLPQTGRRHPLHQPPIAALLSAP